MDFRNIPTFTGQRPWLCGRCRVPLRDRGRRGRALAGSLALYALAATVLGLPLAFPELARVWLVVNLVLAVLVGYVIAALQRCADVAGCPCSGSERPADGPIPADARQNP
jgi:hypothetical protein